MTFKLLWAMHYIYFTIIRYSDLRLMIWPLSISEFSNQTLYPTRNPAAEEIL